MFFLLNILFYSYTFPLRSQKNSSDGFIPGLAAVTKDALDLSSSDVLLLAVCYEATRSKGGARGGGGGKKSKGKNNNNGLSKDANERLDKAKRKTVKAIASRSDAPDLLGGVKEVPQLLPGVGGGLSSGSDMINSESWKGGEVAFQRQRLAATFAFYDTDRSGFLDKEEICQALNAAGFVISTVSLSDYDMYQSSCFGFNHCSYQLFVISCVCNRKTLNHWSPPLTPTVMEKLTLKR